MCLGIPGKIIEIDDIHATVTFGSVKRQIDIRLVEGVKVGEYVLVHAGFAINKISKEDAEETLELIRQIAEQQEELQHQE